MENNKELLELILKALKQNEIAFEQVRDLLQSTGTETRTLDSSLRANKRILNDLGHKLLGDDYGKPIITPEL